MVEEFPSNRKIEQGAKQAPKKVERVVTGEIVRRRTPLSKRLRETFVGNDAGSVWEYVTLDVLVPAAKDMFADAVSEGVERLIFGDSRPATRRARGRSGGSPNGYVSYNRMGPVGAPRDGNRREEPRRMSRQGKAMHNFEDIIFATRVEANEVLERLHDLISQYGDATVANLYEMVGESSSFTDEKYGWTPGGLAGASVGRVRNGYLLDLPKPEPLD